MTISIRYQDDPAGINLHYYKSRLIILDGIHDDHRDVQLVALGNEEAFQRPYEFAAVDAEMDTQRTIYPRFSLKKAILQQGIFAQPCSVGFRVLEDGLEREQRISEQVCADSA